MSRRMHEAQCTLCLSSRLTLGTAIRLETGTGTGDKKQEHALEWNTEVGGDAGKGAYLELMHVRQDELQLAHVPVHPKRYRAAARQAQVHRDVAVATS